MEPMGNYIRYGTFVKVQALRLRVPTLLVPRAEGRWDLGSCALHTRYGFRV